MCKERTMVSCFLPGEVWEGRESKEEQHLAGCVQARQPPQSADGSVAHLRRDREGVQNMREEREWGRRGVRGGGGVVSRLPVERPSMPHVVCGALHCPEELQGNTTLV